MAKRRSKAFNLKVAIEMIIGGDTYRTIAKHFGMPLSTLHDTLNKPEHSARVREALEISADGYADQAEQVLKTLNRKSNQVEFQRARELAQHYRWKAGKRCPKRYSDRTTLTGAEDAAPLQILLTHAAKKKTGGPDA